MSVILSVRFKKIEDSSIDQSPQVGQFKQYVIKGIRSEFVNSGKNPLTGEPFFLGKYRYDSQIRRDDGKPIPERGQNAFPLFKVTPVSNRSKFAVGGGNYTLTLSDGQKLVVERAVELNDSHLPNRIKEVRNTTDIDPATGRFRRKVEAIATPNPNYLPNGAWDAKRNVRIDDHIGYTTYFQPQDAGTTILIPNVDADTQVKLEASEKGEDEWIINYPADGALEISVEDNKGFELVDIAGGVRLAPVNDLDSSNASAELSALFPKEQEVVINRPATPKVRSYPLVQRPVTPAPKGIDRSKLFSLNQIPVKDGRTVPELRAFWQNLDKQNSRFDTAKAVAPKNGGLFQQSYFRTLQAKLDKKI